MRVLKWRFLASLVVLTVLAAGAARPVFAQTNLLPDMDNPKLQFTTGKVVNNKPEMSPVLPAIPGAPSDWKVAQFSPIELVGPESMTSHDPSASDTVFGPALYSFTAPDAHSHVRIFKNSATGHLVYELYESGGALGAGGGSDILLAAGVKKPFPTFAQHLEFSMQAKISRAYTSYDTPAAMRNGAVLAQVGMAFIIQLPSPVNGAASTLFLQISLAHSGPRAQQGLPGAAPFMVECNLFKNGALGLYTVGTLSGKTPLVFAADDGPLHDISFNLNDYISKLLNTPLHCAGKGVASQAVSLASVDPSSIVLKSVFVGPETEIANHLKNSTFTGPQGKAEMAIQVSNLKILSSQ